MFLRSLRINNYRSLEDVRLDGLERFNVLIGRNNSGKSSVFGALQTLNSTLRGGAVEPDRVLTDFNLNRFLKITLSFKLRPQDRREYIDLICAAGPQMNRRDDILRSSLFRQITFHFETLQGQPDRLHLYETKVLVENNEWATIQRLESDAPSDNPQSTVVQVDALRDSSRAVPLDKTIMDVNTANQTRITHTGGLDLHSEMASYAADPQSTPLRASVWPYRRLVKYFSDAFFFDPFRHSTENLEAQESPQLTQEGSNLAQVLFTLHNNNPLQFERIESFVRAALPDIGTLETPLENRRTRAGFRRPSEGPFVRLHDMGGGIEQLLMTATVLMTTGNEGTLFLEEPESHLHAGAQRYLIERFYDGDRQVFVTTHSPTFVNLSRPRSFYQVTYAGGRTAVDRLGEADSLGAMLEDIGARNSDVLLSDAVLFVEGPSDRDVLYAWSKTLGMSLEESNITVLPMDGGDHADRKARVRSEILEGISERAPIPHLLVLDSDERSPAEIKKLQQGLGDKIYLLERREIENDLLVPRAILTALRLKHTSDAPVLERIELACTEDVQALIDTTAESLYGVVLIKRIRATLEGLKGGLLPRDVAESLAPQAHRKDLARLLRGRIRSRVDEHIAGLDIDTTVRSEREAVFARNMRNALPHASFIGFTGTPLMAGEEKTREVFGDYISIYNFRQSVEDGATVPLYYENRIPELQLTNDALNEDLDRVIDEAMLDERQEQRLQREFNREYQLITREKRLEKVAEDLVNHFMGRGQRGKAMVVSIDKATALRMYDKVQKHWLRCLENLKDQLANASSEEERERLAEKISYMETTDMAVVLSQGQNEVEDMMKKGLDIRPHRERMIREDLDTKFKDSDDPFRIVFVCAMWMTGFDAPSVNTIYLDKPMRNHTLMQTIARANRVFGDKQNGLIVDYIGVFRNLEQALAIYGVGGTDGPPVKDKEKLLEALRDAVEETTAFLRDRGVEPQNILDAEGFDLGKLLNEAQEGIVESDESKRGFLALSANVARLYKAILPDPEASEFGPFTKLLSVLTQRIRNLDPEVDISGVMEDINKVLDESITARSFVIPDSKDDEEPVDLSQIDFEALRMRFEHGRKQTEAERLRGQVNSKLRQMVRFNKTRTDYQEQLQRLIDKYNAGSLNIDLYFKALIKIAQELDQEDQRAISEGLSEEELAVFDILTKPEISVTDQEKEEVKRIARDLLEILKREKLVLDWRKRQQARASVRVTVLDELDKLPPAYTDEMYQSKSELIYQHIYDNYYGQGRSVYAQAS